MAHIARRETAGGAARWDVRWKALGRWQTKTFKRRADAYAFRRTVEADELRGVVVDVRRSSVAFGEFAAGWLATRRRPDGRPLTTATRALYADLLHRLILPTFGPAKLASIQPGQVRAWHAKTADRTSPLQAAKAHRLMRTILNTAVRDGLLATNPCTSKAAASSGAPNGP